MRKIILAVLLTTGSVVYAQDLGSLFKPFDACFILYSVEQSKIVKLYSPSHRCQERIAPDSTFKVALSLMAFDQKLISQKTHFNWLGEKGAIPEHQRNQTPMTWLTYSVLWVSQRLTPKLGLHRIKSYLKAFQYGNQDFSGDKERHNGLQFAWLSSSLKISAWEQLAFLKKLLAHKLPVSKQAADNTMHNMFLGEIAPGVELYGKTGAGRHGRNERLSNPSLLRDGWFVGFVKAQKKHYIFVSNLSDKTVTAHVDSNDGSLKPYGSQLLKPIVLTILKDNWQHERKTTHRT